MQRSRFFISTSLEPLAQAPHAVAHGAEDDHLRIVVLLAGQLGREDDESTKLCAAPDTPWKRRRDAFEQVVMDAQRRCSEHPFAVLVDPDALDVGPGDRSSGAWTDASFSLERRDVFRILLGSFRSGGWLLIRPEPKPETTEELWQHDCVSDAVSVPPAASVEEEQLNRALGRVSPALQSLMRGLVRRGRLRPLAAAHLLEAAESEDIEAVVLQTALDMLSAPAVEAAKQLSILRGPRALNGLAGHFPLHDDHEPAAAYSLPRMAVEELADAGWFELGHASAQRRFAFANGIRSFLGEYSALGDAGGVTRMHHWLGSQEGAGIDDRLEAHYHAVSSGDVALAVKTAHHYGSDLRRLARSLSDRNEFLAAAGVYREIVERFDRTDAYAWEYYAYNLARCHASIVPPEVEKSIRSAYANACKYDNTNPLYCGRELGFRARMGENIQGEFDSQMYEFQQVRGSSAVSFFAKPALEGLPADKRKEVARRWIPVLRQHAELKDVWK